MENKPSAAWQWCNAACVGLTSSFAAGARGIQPDLLVWILAIWGALLGVAIIPSGSLRRTLQKLGVGATLGVIGAKPLAESHLTALLQDERVAAFWLGYAGPALFAASLALPSILPKTPVAKT